MEIAGQSSSQPNPQILFSVTSESLVGKLTPGAETPSGTRSKAVAY